MRVLQTAGDWNARWYCVGEDRNKGCGATLEISAMDHYKRKVPKKFLFWKWEKTEVFFRCVRCGEEIHLPKFKYDGYLGHVMDEMVFNSLPWKDTP